jgi:dimethylsulfone monooxygenase
MAATPTTRARRFETVAWLCGLLALTRLGTVHAPLFNPLIAAKEFVTADHIGEGRFGLNLVVGWNEDEFEMFGVKQRDHVFRASQQFFNQPCSRCR